MAPDTGAHIAAILNAAWHVRHYARGRYTTYQAPQRTAALRALGLACRAAFNSSDDFEALLGAIVEGLVPHDEPRF